jgi:hypothetical protein
MLTDGQKARVKSMFNTVHDEFVDELDILIRDMILTEVDGLWNADVEEARDYVLTLIKETL